MKLVMALSVRAPRLSVGCTLQSPLAPGVPGFVCWRKCLGAVSSLGTSPRPRSCPLPQLPPERAGHHLSQRRLSRALSSTRLGLAPAAPSSKTCAVPLEKRCTPGEGGKGGETGKRYFWACHSDVGSAGLQIVGVLTACFAVSWELWLWGAWSKPGSSVVVTRLYG